MLSNREKKAQYDNEIENYKRKPQNICEPGRECESTFWTVCPYCYHMYEYEKKYEECGLRCQQCRRAFHGVAVAPPPKSVWEEGKEGYYFGYGVFPLAYENVGFSENKESGVPGGDDGSLGDKKEDGCGVRKCNLDNFVEISDDSDDNGGNEQNEGRDICVKLTTKGLEEGAVKEMGEKVEENVRLGEMGRNVPEIENSEVRNEGKRPMRRVKITRNSKKTIGKGIRLTTEGLEEDAVREMGEKAKENVPLGEMGCNAQEIGNSGVRNIGTRPMRRVKSVTRNSKKIMGKGIKCRTIDLPVFSGRKDMHMNMGFGEAVEEHDR